jgi:hypothetical protein
MDGQPDAAGQIPAEDLGEALTGLAVAGGLGRDGGEPAIRAILLEARDGVIAGVVAGEDLGEKDAERDPRVIEAIAPAMVVAVAGLGDGLSG